MTRIITINEAIAKNPYQHRSDVWMGDEVRHMIALRDAGYAFVVGTDRSRSTVYGPGAAIDSVAVAHNLLPLDGRNAYAVRTLADAEILLGHDETKARDAHDRYVSHGVRDIIRECATLDHQDDNLRRAGYTDEEIAEADNAGLIDEFGNIDLD